MTQRAPLLTYKLFLRENRKSPATSLINDAPKLHCSISYEHVPSIAESHTLVKKNIYIFTRIEENYFFAPHVGALRYNEDVNISEMFWVYAEEEFMLWNLCTKRL